MDLEKVSRLIKENILGGKSAGVHEPMFGGNEQAYVRECIETGWVSSAGKFVDKFEDELASYTGAKYVIAMVNGTSALHISLILAGVRQDHEVILSPMTFVATVNAISYLGAIPHFVDIETDTFGLDPAKLDLYLASVAEKRSGTLLNKFTGRTIQAIMPMHAFGEPVRMDALMSVAQKYGLIVVEDAAEGLGSFFAQQHVGTFGALAALSFNGNKIITTGGGGAVLTDDKKLAATARHLSTTAKVEHPWRYFHDVVGYNYRLPNINAALGCAQLERLPELLQRKRNLFKRYCDVLDGVEGLTVFKGSGRSRSNRWLNALVLDRTDVTVRDALLGKLNASGIGARPCWTLMHKLPMYMDCPRDDLYVAEDLESRIINVPSGPILGKMDDQVSDRI